MRSRFLEEGISSSQEALLIPPHSHTAIPSAVSSMSTNEPDLERGDGALKVPSNPFAASSPSPKSTAPPVGDTQRHRVGPPPFRASAKSRPQSNSRNRQSQHRPLSKAIHHDHAAIPPKLLKLRTVIGISTPENLAITTSSGGPFNKRPGPNLGIYARIIAEEKVARFQFYFAASVINVCYLGQIVVAAALTALGASSSNHIVITVLGALNTVIAGILTYLKGQGLPNRLRQYWTGLRKCREFIEEKERECAAERWDEEDEDGMDVEREIDVMLKMYHDVRQTAEDNTPDTYLPMQGQSASLLSRTHPSAAEKPNNGGSIPCPEEEDEFADTESDHDTSNTNDTSKSIGISPPQPTPAPATTMASTLAGSPKSSADQGFSSAMPAV
ncbi:MAG: hypothetical protein Q9216_002456 [Gyalolechia sp. 2 TL-2023]